ncbi:cyclophilin-like fold protein [Paenibacillus solani]|uniref:cyclophilin-like fold protein n=1 Tax=Paenibacillus solani TaxID=1705565 RepID=UPI003D2D5917
MTPFSIDNEVFTVGMPDNPTSRDFISRLPLTLTFKEYGGFEKLTILDEGLTTEGAPSGSVPEVGDIGYYAPWKDVNMYYQDWSYSSELVKIGKIESDLEAFTNKLQSMNDDFTVTFEKVK